MEEGPARPVPAAILLPAGSVLRYAEQNPQ